jgi:benzoylformate decarboxylase
MAGQLYNASRDGSAIVVTAGLNDNEVWSDEVRLGPRPGFDQKEVNRQFAKISWEARQAASLPLMLRRAFKVATTEPGGPVYLATASNALEEKNISASIYPAERFLSRAPVHADPAAVRKAARLLIAARRPVLIAGDGIWKSSAQEELVELTEQLGLPVAFPNAGAERDPIFANFPTNTRCESDIGTRYPNLRNGAWTLSSLRVHPMPAEKWYHARPRFLPVRGLSGWGSTPMRWAETTLRTWRLFPM